jgi:transcriptional regulator with XRE-family HTH domain
LETLKRIRKSKGLSQGELAKKAGVSPTTVFQIERGISAGSPEILLKLSAALGVGIGELLGEVRPPNPELEERARDAEAAAFRAERRYARLLAGFRRFLDTTARRWERPGEGPTPPEARAVLSALEQMVITGIFEPGSEADAANRAEAELIHRAIERLRASAEPVLEEEYARRFRAVETATSVAAVA